MKKMTREAAAKIQSNICKANNGITPKGSFAARAMSAAYKNEPLASVNQQSNLLCQVGIFAVAVGVAAASYYAYQSLRLSQ